MYLNYRSPEVEIDVVDMAETHSPPYDINKSRSLMEECERHVNILHSDDGDPDWEDHISRYHFSSLRFDEETLTI